MKTIKHLLLALTLSAALIDIRGEEDWRRVAFAGEARVKTMSGLVEVLDKTGNKILHAGEPAHPGQTLRVWKGAEIVLWMENSQSLVRAEGPVLVRLTENENYFDRASSNASQNEELFVVRAVRGGGKYCQNGQWNLLTTGMSLPAGTKVRPFRQATLDFYNPSTHTALRVVDHTKPTTLSAKTKVPAVVLVSQVP